ncbi:hypothetical protein NPIL_223561 [Nephila pilipes]|uniref:Uncharacterized protein n=1 Tax=Nephila pilipes TaxID=299642 RepID=A0A8X6NLP8_NEPPI|nr:hypothetical protein NPIL_223561 [Nephila pilipes]
MTGKIKIGKSWHLWFTLPVNRALVLTRRNGMSTKPKGFLPFTFHIVRKPLDKESQLCLDLRFYISLLRSLANIALRHAFTQKCASKKTSWSIEELS